MLRIATFALPFALSLSSACTTPQQVMDQATNDMVLEAYAVPVGYSGLMASALTRALFVGDNAVGRVIETPDGQIIVVAPESVQVGVKRLIEQLNAAQPPVRTPTNIRIDYWLVHGTRAEAPATTFPAPALAETLAAVQQAEGPMAFELYAHKVLTSLDEEEARISAAGLFIEQEASWNAAGGTITAEVAIDASGGTGMRTDIRLSPGQVVVLGEVADISGDQPYDTLYYIISPTVVGAD
jgi:hypothetical protein